MKKLFAILVSGFVLFGTGCATARTGYVLMKECKIPPSVTDCSLVYRHDYETKQELYFGRGVSKIPCEQMRKLLKGKECMESYRIKTKQNMNEGSDIRL